MNQSDKYPRTFHYPFSPGTTSDDRINHNYWKDLQKIEKVVHTEKLDGENSCLNKYGVFARSHATPTNHPWANHLKKKWSLIKYDLDNLEIFGENLYAVHSIEYLNLENHFYVFGIRENGIWLSWEETKFYAKLFDFEVVPEIKIVTIDNDKDKYESDILDIIKEKSIFNSYDTYLSKEATMEGIVTRNIESYHTDNFKNNVFKYVRKGHVKTGEHWRKNWKRTKLIWERK